MKYRGLLFALLAVPAVAQDTRSLSLEEALALATATSEQVTIARAGVDRARANVRLTESQGLPQIYGSASYQRQLASQFEGIGGDDQAPPPPQCTGPFMPDPSLPLEERVRLLEERLACPPAGGFGGIDVSQLGFGAPNTWNGGLQFSWPLYTGGRVQAQTRAARASREIASTNLTSTQAQVRLDVTTAYFDVQLADELVDTTETGLRISEEMLELTELRARAGVQAEFDVLQARVARDNQRPILIRRRTQRELAYDRLRLLLDLPQDVPLRLTTPVGASAARSVNTEVDPLTRVAVQQADRRLSATRALLDAARALRKPTLTATSQYGIVAFSESFLPDLGSFRNNWTVGAAVQIPIYTGGAITAQIDSARADVTEAQAQFEATVEASRLDTDSALAELRAARATLEATEGTVDAASRAYEIARLRYREGVSTQIEVDNARLQLEQARLNRAQAARDLWIAQTRVELLPFLPFTGAQGQQQLQQQQQQQTPAGALPQRGNTPLPIRPAAGAPGQQQPPGGGGQ